MSLDSNGKLVGTSVLRREDQRFLTGSGCFTDDLETPDTVYAYVLRSVHAHARIKQIAVKSARTLAGVVAIYIASDLQAAGVKPIPSLNQSPPFALTNRDGSSVPLADQYPLAQDKVRYVGEPVAFVIADTVSHARDAAEAIDIEYEPLPAVIDKDAALTPGAPSVWDQLQSNQSFDWGTGDAHAVERRFEQAAHVSKIVLEYPRVVVAFMEPRAVVATPDPQTGRITFWAGTQAPHRILGLLSDVLGIPAEDLHVITPDMGGGFGARGGLYPEFILTVFGARSLGRTVRWTGERGEGFLSDSQARDQRITIELALDEQGHFLALRFRATFRHGAYVPGRSLWAVALHQAQMICGVYRIPEACFELKGVFTNTAPVSPLRGVARAEAAYGLERLVDAAARETGRDNIELRRLNLIGSHEMPWQTPVGSLYDSGDFAANLGLALEAGEVETFARRRQEAQARGVLRGLGVAVYIENTMGVPTEFAEVVAGDDASITAHMGTQNFGMGHETVFAQVLADALEVGIERISIDYGDTDQVRTGAGSHGSRSMRIGGTALVYAARAFLEKARGHAAELLEVATADLEYLGGRFTIRGTDRDTSLPEVARFVESRGDRLSAEMEHEVKVATYPNGCHLCEVEIDPETGGVQIVNHIIVADVGRTVNPMIVHGQLHGGLAQGLGHVLAEEAAYDPATGQLLSGSFMDYAIPRADDLPEFVSILNDVPTAENPLGVKGAGEGPTTGSPPAMMNAIIDALSAHGITHLDMPATSERVWRALRNAQLTVS